MRFIEAGPDIPSDLIVAQERGEALFVCGAGVSRTADLPLFGELVKCVYQRLGEDWSHHPAEREGMNEGGKLFGQYDRVLRCLERRVAASEAPRNRNMRKRIRAAVRDELAAPAEADLSNHMALMELSRDAQGRSRLLTTNFDTLFEHAWSNQYGKSTTSHAGVALPRPMSDGFVGVLHLHGRLADPLVDVTETDLVLTSAEFGDAYLRSGWASRYVYDLARTHTLVLVGYQADDPPMRYLLEALEADRELYPDLRNVYAFGGYSVGDKELMEALWRAKGIEPILYQSDNNGHAKLYTTLREWRLYAKDPTAWRRERLRGLLDDNPLPSSEDNIDRCLEVLDRGDASQLLGELSPDAAWLPVIAQRGVFKQQLPDAWIASRVDDAEMIRACAALTPLDEQARWRIERTLEQAGDELTAVREKAWRLLLSMRRSTANFMFDNGWHDWKPLIRRGQTNFQARNAVAGILTPSLRLSKPLLLSDADSTSPETLYKLLRIDLEPADYPPPSEILEAWPDTLEDGLALFKTLNRFVVDALEQAADLGMTGNWDRPSRNIPSIAKHPQNTHRGGFRPIVRALAMLWQRIAKHDPAHSRLLAARWRESPFLLLRRLHIFTIADDAWPPNDAAEAALALNDQDFWNHDAQVEIMRLLAERWVEFDESKCAALEGRLCEGISTTLFPEGAKADDEQWQSVVDSSIYRRLSRIASTGGNLSANARTLLAEIGARHPKWQPGSGDRDDFSIWHESRVGPDGHPELLADVDDSRLVQEAFRLQEELQLEEGDLWRVFCSADPERALRGLKHDGDAGHWDPNAWRCLLWAAGEEEDLPFQHELAELIHRMPDEALKKLLPAASSWIARQRKALAQAIGDGEPCFLSMWDLLAGLAYQDEEDAEVELAFGDDLMTEALNRPGGDLASALLDTLVASEPADNSGLGSILGSKFLKIVEAQNRAGLLGRVNIVRQLAYMDAIDPDWANTHLVSRLDWSHDEALSMWRAYAHGRLGSARLFNALKPAMLESFERNGLSTEELEGIFLKLLMIELSHLKGQHVEYALTSPEVKRALVAAPERVRQTAAWHLWTMMSKEAEPNKATHWCNVVKPLIQRIWPLDADARGSTISKNLVLMALECGDALADAVDTIIDFVVPYQLYRISHAFRLENHHQRLFTQHPQVFLKLANILIDSELYPVPSDLPEFLGECTTLDPNVENQPAFIRLYGLRRQQNS